MSTPTEPTPAASTDRQQAEAVLRRNAEALAALVEQSPLGIYTVDSQFRVRNVSAGAMPAFRNVQPLVGRDFAEVMRILWPESFASEAIRIFRRTLQTGEPYVSPGLTEKRNDIGAIESYEWQVNRVTLADGLPGVVCYYFDTTRLQQAHQAARESEERFRTLVEALPELVQRFPARYRDLSLKELSDQMHRAMIDLNLAGLVNAACDEDFDPVLTPAQTYQKLVRQETESIPFREMAGRIAAVMLVPYPPGIPMSMPGERLGGSESPVIKLLLAMEEFGKRFPGFEREVHGIEVDSNGQYWMRAVNEEPAKKTASA